MYICYEKNGAPPQVNPTPFHDHYLLLFGESSTAHNVYFSCLPINRILHALLVSLRCSKYTQTNLKIYSLKIWKLCSPCMPYLEIVHSLEKFIWFENLFWFLKIYLICEFENLFRKFMLFQNYLHKVSKFRQKCLKHHLT